MKVFNGFMMVVFIVFAVLQYNDPDPEKWVPLYLYAALICWWAIRQRFYPLSYWLGFLAYGGYAIYKVFDNNGLVDWITKHHAQNIAATMKAETPWVEESREFFGLLIIIIVLVINYLHLSRLKSKG